MSGAGRALTRTDQHPVVNREVETATAARWHRGTPRTLSPCHKRPKRSGIGATTRQCRCGRWSGRLNRGSSMMSMRWAAITGALVGLITLGGARRGLADGPQCFLCICGDVGPPFVTKCSSTPLVDFASQCTPPSCTSEFGIKTSTTPCNDIPACQPFLSRAPALSGVPLAGLGVLLLGGGIWLTRKRSQSAS